MRKFPTGFGIVLLTLFAIFVIWGGWPSDPAALVQLLTFVLAGALLLVGGVIDAFSIDDRTVRWYVPFGVGLSLVGLSFSLGLLVSPSVDGSIARTFVTVLALVNAVLFVYIGADNARGNTYVNALKPQ
ncbi:hypothetical protein [Halalkalicoccus subterraneus]|uniref:hypothetical protein n=1 Tax=Halalkalicoccus subterraneus TaxID=2675002 RepID=UPI000EFCEAA0|nr:hypothetical protein [Halalkalicoccus subterraneus]